MSTISEFQIGDIIIWNTGYSMVLPHFGKIVSFTPSGKSARIVELASNLIDHDGYGQQGHKIPTDQTIGVVKTCRLKSGTYGTYAVIDKHPAHKWNGEPAWYDSMD